MERSLYKRALQLGVLLLYLRVGGGANQLACPAGVQRLISYNQTLLPMDNVTATSEHSSFNPDKYLFHRNNIPVRLWCTLPDAGLEHHINATFTEPVVITGLVSSGFSNGYVNNFTVGFSMHKGEGFTLYQDEHIEWNFIVPQIDTVFGLQTPFAAVQLHFTINGGVVAPSNRLCWHLTVIGCTLSEDVTLIPDPVIIQYQNYRSTRPVTLIPDPMVIQPCATPTLPTLEAVLVKDYQALSITLPVAMVTILLVVIVVSLGVFLCLRNRTWKTTVGLPKRIVPLSGSDTVKVLDNSTLCKPSSMADTVGYESVSSAGADMTGSMVYNQNYSVPHSLQHCTVDMVHNPSYSVSLRPTANADHPLTASTNIYEAPQ